MPIDLLRSTHGVSTRTYQTAITGSVDRETMRLRVEEIFEDLGFEEPPAIYDPSGDYLTAEIIGSDEVGHCLLIRETAESCLAIAQSLSVMLDLALSTFEVSIEPGSCVQGVPGAPRVRAVTVAPNGSMTDISPSFDVDESIVCDDCRKTARRLLLALIDDGISTLRDDSDRIWLYRERGEPEPEEPEIEPRLAALVKDLEGVEDVSLTEVAGQQAIRFVQADGTRRMSVVSDEDLQIIEEETGRAFR